MKKSLLKDRVFGALKEESSSKILNEQVSIQGHQQLYMSECPNGTGHTFSFSSTGTPSVVTKNGGPFTPGDIGQNFEWTSSNTGIPKKGVLVSYGPVTTCSFHPVNCIFVDFTPSLPGEGCDGIDGCTDPTALNYDPLANWDDGSCIYPPPPACQSGAFPSFSFTNGCDPNANYHTWAGGYTTTGNSFIWQGGTINDPAGNTINNGDQYPASFINLALANQSSYCEWCDDFAQGGGSSSQFLDWVQNIWHSPTQSTPWLPTVMPSNLEAHCCCCPGQGGAPFNPTMSLSVAPPFDNTGIDPTDIDREPTSDVCCNWCATVDPDIPSKPPAGCYDFDCNDCLGFKPKPKPTSVIPEHLKRSLQRRAGIIK